MQDIKSPETRRSRRRVRTRWNYRRIGIALAAIVIISGTAAYGGYSLAHRFSAGAEKEIEKTATKPVEIASKVVKPPSTTTTTEPQYIEHTVKRGDSYYALALKYGTTVERIKELNGVKNDNGLQIGIKLKIPVKEAAAKVDEKTQSKDEEDKTIEKQQDIEVSSKELFRGPVDKKRVTLTFDAGASSEATPRILKALKGANVKATFFLTGKWIEDNSELTKKIVEQGHRIGNHTYSHPDLTKLATNNEIVNELSKMEEIVASVANVSTKPLFRPPYGMRNARVLRVAANAGYRSIYWTIDSYDWKQTMKPEQVKNRVVSALTPGAIILMHCGSDQTAEILPELIEEIKIRDYEIVTLSELFQ
ncbi:MAG: polysaccharide deacetylase family protein [Actinobacteria bacterium]|nr:polysaccharide deacetylase family protein [Actinomycetota bacterium]